MDEWREGGKEGRKEGGREGEREGGIITYTTVNNSIFK